MMSAVVRHCNTTSTAPQQHVLDIF